MSAPEDCIEIILPEKLDSAAASDLYAQIDAKKDASLRLNGEQVTKIGGLCLQILVSAKEEWSRQGQTFEIQPASEALSDFLNAIERQDLINAEPACL